MNLPNSITLFRIALVPFFFTTLVSYDQTHQAARWWAALLLATAGCSDVLDGFLARVLNQRTRLGSYLDPIADKMMIFSGYLGLLCVEALAFHPPLWVTVSVIFRDIVLVAGGFMIYLVTGALSVQPNKLGKITTGSQMVTLFFVLLQWPAAAVMWTVTAVLTIVSGIVYVVQGLQQMNGSGT